MRASETARTAAPVCHSSVRMRARGLRYHKEATGVGVATLASVGIPISGPNPALLPDSGHPVPCRGRPSLGVELR